MQKTALPAHKEKQVLVVVTDNKIIFLSMCKQFHVSRDAASELRFNEQLVHFESTVVGCCSATSVFSALVLPGLTFQ